MFQLVDLVHPEKVQNTRSVRKEIPEGYEPVEFKLPIGPVFSFVTGEMIIEFKFV